MTELNNIIEIVYRSFTPDEILILNGILKIKDSEERYVACRKFVFSNNDIYLRIKVIVDPAWLTNKLYLIGKDYEF